MLQRPSRWTWSALAIVVVVGAATVPALMFVLAVVSSTDLQFTPYACTYALMFTLAQLLVRATGSALGASVVTAVILSLIAGEFTLAALVPIIVAGILELGHAGTTARRWAAWRSYVSALVAVAMPTAVLTAGTMYGGFVLLIFLPIGLVLTAVGVFLLRLVAPSLIRLFGRDRSAGPAGQH